MKIFIGVVVVIGILVGGFFVLNNYIYNEKQADTADHYKNAEYIIDGKRIKLENGLSEMEVAPGSASKIITRYFGNEVTHDFNGDGREDVAFLLTQETGGSGVFYYVVAALNTEAGYVGSQALYLGDRIAPQTTELSQNQTHKDVIVVNYADRAPGESFSTEPRVGKSIWLKLDPEALQFGEVVQNFEGEADPSRMTLSMKTWTWIRADYKDGSKITPKQSEKFTISFSNNKRFSATTDCNSMSGEYSTRQSDIIFENIASTKMFCENSQEAEFSKLLLDSDSYHFTSRGELILDLKLDSGSVIFR